MPRHSTVVTMECAGNGRALLAPRPVSQPWLTGAVGTPSGPACGCRRAARGRGRRRRRRRGVHRRRPRTGARVAQDYQRGLPVAEATAPDVARLRDERTAAAPAARVPAAAGGPRLVRPGAREVAARLEVLDREFDGSRTPCLPPEADRRMPAPRSPGSSRGPAGAPGWPDFMSRDRVARRGEQRLEGRAWSGWGRVAGRGQADDGRPGGRRPSRTRRGHTPGSGSPQRGRPARASTCSGHGHTTRPAGCSRSMHRGTAAGSRTTPTLLSGWW